MNGRICLVIAAATIVGNDVHGGQLVPEQIFADDAGNARLPADKIVYRLYWLATEADHQLVGVVGSPSNPLNLSVTGGTFFDSSHFAAGDRPPLGGFLGQPGFEELSYDSWFTIGNTSLDIGPAWPSGEGFTDQVITAPGTSFDAGGLDTWSGGPGGPDNVAWTAPPSQDDPGGGGVVNTPQTVAGNWEFNRIAIMQIVIDPGPDGVIESFEGCLGLLLVEGSAVKTGACFVVEPAPGALSVLALALAGGAGARRRRS